MIGWTGLDSMSIVVTNAVRVQLAGVSSIWAHSTLFTSAWVITSCELISWVDTTSVDLRAILSIDTP